MSKFTTQIIGGLSALLLVSSASFAATVEVNGFVGFDSNIISKFDHNNATATDTDGDKKTQAIKNTGKNTAGFQSYLFHLDPTIIINDAATIKGEISTNYGRGGLLGESTQSAQNPQWFAPTYLLSTQVNNGSNALTINQLYAELYTDLGTVQLGRFAQHWGLGAINHAGTSPWNRYVSAKDGIAIKAKIGHFKITPWWAKLGNSGSLTSSGARKEYGLALL